MLHREPTTAEIGEEPRCPYTAGQSAGDAHRIYARLAGPIRQWRAIEHDRSGQSLAVGGKDGERPARLAIAVKDRRLAWMATRYVFNKASKRMEHVRKSLARTWLKKEYHEV